MSAGRVGGRIQEQVVIRDVADAIVFPSATFTRPSNTNAYIASGVVSNSTSAPVLLEFAGAANTLGGNGVILSARHMKSSTTTVGANFRLMLYRVGTVTPINDNAPFTMLWANRANRVGFVDFAHTSGGSGSDSSGALSTYVGLPFVCGAATSSLFGILTTQGAYTPASAEQHYIELAISQN
jgi:hypothetical protein